MIFPGKSGCISRHAGSCCLEFEKCQDIVDDRYGSSVHDSFDIEQSENHEERRASYAEIKAEPVRSCAKIRHAVQKEAHWEASAPVSGNHKDEGYACIFQSAKNSLNRSGNRVEELPSGAVDQELCCNGCDSCIIRVYHSDGMTEEERKGNGHKSASHRCDETGFFITACQGNIPCTCCCCNQDCQRHGAADWKHVHETCEVVRNLVAYPCRTWQGTR